MYTTGAGSVDQSIFVASLQVVIDTRSRFLKACLASDGSPTDKYVWIHVPLLS